MTYHEIDIYLLFLPFPVDIIEEVRGRTCYVALFCFIDEDGMR